MTERETRVKRLRIRAWRRGTREMDLLLGGYVDRVAAELATSALAEAELAALEALAAEEDGPLYAWITGAAPAPAAHAATVARLRAALGLEATA